MKTLSFLSLVLLSILFLSCGGDNTPEPNQSDAFLKYYGGNRDQGAQDVLALDDGGFLLLGFSNSFAPSGNNDWYLVRTDVSGNELWSKTFDLAGLEDQGEKILALTDGFLLGGTVNTADSLEKIMILKTDLEGNEIWRSVLKENQTDTEEQFSDFQPAIAGESGFVVVGSTSDVNTNKNDYDPLTDFLDIYTGRIDENGILTWEAINGFGDLDFGASIEVFGNTYIVSGDAFITQKNTRNLYLIRYNSIGLPIETLDFGDALDLKANDTHATVDGGLVFLGTQQTSNQIVFAKVSEGLVPGTLITLNTIETLSGVGVIENADSELLITATQFNTEGNNNIMLMESDLLGSVNWTRTFGNPDEGEDAAGFPKLHQNSGYLIPGEFDISTNRMAGFLRVDENGRLLTE